MPLCKAAASVALLAEYRLEGLLYCILTAPAGCEPRNGRAERLYLLPMCWISCTRYTRASTVIFWWRCKQLSAPTQMLGCWGYPDRGLGHWLFFFNETDHFCWIAAIMARHQVSLHRLSLVIVYNYNTNLLSQESTPLPMGHGCSPTIHCVQKKNTHSHFLPYLHEWCVDLNKNCSEYT